MPGQVDSTLVMLSPGEIAKREGVSKQAISKVIKRFLDEGHDLPVERDGRGRIARLSLAHLDHLRGRYENSAKVSAGRQQSVREPQPDLPWAGDDDRPGNESRDEAMRQQAWLKLRRDQLDHDEEMKKLLRADKVDEGLAQAGRAIRSEISRLQNYADDLALAVSKEGTSGARMMLRKISVEIGDKVADRLGEIARSAPEGDEPLTIDEDAT